MTLALARDLTLPDEAAVQKFAILAMSGAGKSNTAVVMAEEMFAAGIPWVAIDPKGDWWGIRAGRDGAKGGLPVPVLGGSHGDIPLEPTAGKLIANLVVDRRLTCVLDVSDFDTRQQMFGFLADFAETLLKRNTAPLHVFAEEADDYLPQNPREKGNAPRCLGAWQRLIKRGRFKGIGATLVTQRSSAINKDALNMTDTLIVMRMTAPLDHKAIRPWIMDHGLAPELIDSLPSLDDGEAWVWSPQRLHLQERVKVRRRSTYDSGATPFALTKATKAATLADIDLDVLKADMADTIERVKADDPAELRKQLRAVTVMRDDLRSRVEYLEAMPVNVVERERPVPFPDPEGIASIVLAVNEAVHTESNRIAAHFAIERDGTVSQPPSTGGSYEKFGRDLGEKIVESASPAERSVAAMTEAVVAGPPTATDELGKPHRLILGALAQHGDLDKRALAVITGYAHGGGAFGNAVGRLRSLGLVEPGWPMRLTPAGMHAVNRIGYEALPTGRGLLDWWMEQPQLGAAHREILRVLGDSRGPLDKFAIAARSMSPSTGGPYEPGGGAFGNALGRLRTLGLIVKSGTTFTLAEELRDGR